MPNPNVSSPLFSSVLAIHLSTAAERQTKGFKLSEQQQMTLAGGQRVTLSNGGADRITIQVVVNFPDYESEPLTDVPGNVRNSNPFGVFVGEHNLFVTNGGLNRVVKVDLATGAYATLASFARIKTIDRTTGDQSDFITGLRIAIGVLPLKNRNDVDYLVLENNFAPVPGFPPTGAAIKHFETPESAPSVVNECTLYRPTAMSLDQSAGAIYVTELLRGTVVRVPLD